MQQHPLCQESNKDSIGAGYSQEQLQKGWSRHWSWVLSLREHLQSCIWLARGWNLPGDPYKTPVKPTQRSPQSPVTQRLADTGTSAVSIGWARAQEIGSFSSAKLKINPPVPGSPQAGGIQIAAARTAQDRCYTSSYSRLFVSLPTGIASWPISYCA